MATVFKSTAVVTEKATGGSIDGRPRYLSLLTNSGLEADIGCQGGPPHLPSSLAREKGWNSPSYAFSVPKFVSSSERIFLQCLPSDQV